MTARLEISTFGGLVIKLDGAPITKLASRKAEALLVYVACTGKAQARESLATMLWDDRPQDRAMANLRVVLSSLRQTLGPYVAISRQSVAVNSDSPPWVDAVEFEQGLNAARKWRSRSDGLSRTEVTQLARTVDLFQGGFLQGFYPHQCRDFEEWQAAERERLRLRMIEALVELGADYLRLGEYTAGIEQARRLLQLEPLHEEAHRQLMRLYVWTDQRPAAIHQYRAWTRLLAEEMSIQPSEETTALYEAIKSGAPLDPPVQDGGPGSQEATALRGFVSPSVHYSPVRPGRVTAPFVARDDELAELSRALDAALAEQGRIVFVTGEAGSGKTALVHEFARQTQAAVAELVAVFGRCDAHTGVGDPYLPWRDMLGLLTGDVEARWARGLVTRENARRLKALLPDVLQALFDLGPALIDTFIPRIVLAHTLERMQQPDQLPAAPHGLTNPAQNDFFEQYTSVLQAVASQQPLLLVIDDAQWADDASISLMFHLARQLKGSRILLLVTYRPEDVALGRGGSRHPLEPVANEFNRSFGNIRVDLDRAMGRHFVEAYVDTQANRLGSEFRSALYGQTQGHPLFTVELLRAMQERGDLVRDQAGCLVEGPSLNWETLPAKVEAVIKERIDRLDDALRQVLTVASIEGEEFTAQVVARVVGTSERLVLHQLAQARAVRHNLVREQGEVRLNGRYLSRYRFTHALFQQYLGHLLDTGERRLLHGEIARALEEIYQEQRDEITVRLARHCAAAGLGEQAVYYLLRAGDQARGLYAHREAINHYRQALAFLKEQGDHEGAARTWLKLGLTYHNAFDFKRAREAYDRGFILWQQTEGFEADTPPPPAPHALRLAWGEPVVLDPTMSADNSSEGIIFHLFSGLLEQRPEMEVVPDVAHSWEVLSGGRQYVFHLRDDVFWSDGVRVTAGDFEYAWKRTLDPSVGSPNASLLYDIKGAMAFHQGTVSSPDQVGVAAAGEHTLTVQLAKPTGYFLGLLTSTATYPLPRHMAAGTAGRPDSTRIVTNGPFMLESWQPERSMVLTRNPAYHGRLTGNVERVELSLLTDLTALAAYGADDLDLFHNLWNLPVTAWPPILQQHAGEHVSLPELATHYLRFDLGLAPFNDLRVRHAFALAADQETLADVVLQGFVSPATGGFVPVGMPGHSAGIGLPYDPERARQLLAEAGYPGGLGFPVVKAMAPRGRGPWCDYLRHQWQSILGVTTVWETLSWATFLDRLHPSPPPLVINGWVADYPDPDNFLRVGVPSDEIGWRNDDYLKLVEKAGRVPDQTRRMQLYGQADRILVQDAAFIPLLYRRFQMLIKPWVKKYPTSANRTSFWKDTIIEAH